KTRSVCRQVRGLFPMARFMGEPPMPHIDSLPIYIPKRNVPQSLPAVNVLRFRLEREDLLPALTGVGAAEDARPLAADADERASVGRRDLAGGNGLGQVAPGFAVSAGAGELGGVARRLGNEPEFSVHHAQHAPLAAGGVGTVPAFAGVGAE